MRKILTSDHLFMVQSNPLGMPIKANIGVYIKMPIRERKLFTQSHCLVGAWWVKMKKKEIQFKEIWSEEKKKNIREFIMGKRDI